jgi:group I intron endonuclease
MSFIIYKVTNKINLKVYIGYTKIGIEERLHKHLTNALSGIDTQFYRAIRKYGIVNFTWCEIDNATEQEQAKDKEKNWIEYFDSFKNGYNMTIGGDGGDIINQLSKEKYDVFIEKMRNRMAGCNNHNHSGLTDEQIVDYAIDCFIKNEMNWIQTSWFEDYCKKYNIPQNLSKCRFNGLGFKGLKNAMVLKLKSMGFEVSEIKYRVTKEHKEKLAELYRNKKWYHNDALKRNKQLAEHEVSEGWELGKNKY